jgi:hypothetical protein
MGRPQYSGEEDIMSEVRLRVTSRDRKAEAGKRSKD